jgi:hypothetical protein
MTTGFGKCRVGRRFNFFLALQGQEAPTQSGRHEEDETTNSNARGGSDDGGIVD